MWWWCGSPSPHSYHHGEMRKAEYFGTFHDSVRVWMLEISFMYCFTLLYLVAVECFYFRFILFVLACVCDLKFAELIIMLISMFPSYFVWTCVYCYTMCIMHCTLSCEWVLLTRIQHRSCSCTNLNAIQYIHNTMDVIKIDMITTTRSPVYTLKRANVLRMCLCLFMFTWFVKRQHNRDKKFLQES